MSDFGDLLARMERLESKFDRLIWTLAIGGFTTGGSCLFFMLQTLASAHSAHGQ